jgi:hypothetical protein
MTAGRRGARGFPYTPGNLVGHFGSESPLARQAVRELYRAITETDNPKAGALFDQWKALFSESRGYDADDPRKRVSRLAEHYAVPGATRPLILFAVHSYYAIFLKLLAAEIAASLSPQGVSTAKRCASAATARRLHREVERLEAGRIWAELGITNFLQGDTFSWYLAAWDNRLAGVIRSLARTLDEFDPGTFTVKPAASSDLLKMLYQHLFPRALRHDLGEYYTPDWLADFVLDELGYIGDPDKRLLDPACGSGTFLVTTLNRIKAWFRRHRHRCGYGMKDLLGKILKNVIGFDLNPLAVMAARTNYLLAIRELIGQAPEIEIPVYLCDSLFTPAAYPTEGDGLPPALAPPLLDRVDYVAGNPPWITWDSLPAAYRDHIKPLWQHYGLFTLSGTEGRLGGGKKDISMLFVYRVADHYLKDGGRLGFLTTQSVFKTRGAGEGFRRLEFGRGGQRRYLKPTMVHDLSEIQVFEGALNRTAFLICEKSAEEIRYPVPYISWRGPSRITMNQPLRQVLALTSRTELEAIPVEPGNSKSPWLTAPRAALPGLRKVVGRSDYEAHEGVNSGGLNGCFWIRILEKRGDGTLVIENLHDVGRIKVQQVRAVIEPDLVYPLLRGRNVSRWRARPAAHIILAQDVQKGKGIAERAIKRDYPKTFAYLKRFEGDRSDPPRGTLRGRALYKKYFRPKDPFYSMYNVSPASISPWKVVWNRIDTSLQGAAVGPHRQGDIVLCQETHTFVAVAGRAEAEYFSAVLNSAPSDLLVRCYSAGKSFASAHVLRSVRIPLYDRRNGIHRRLRDLGRGCHLSMSANRVEEVIELEWEIAQAAAELWGIGKHEIKAIWNCIRSRD